MKSSSQPPSPTPSDRLPLPDEGHITNDLYNVDMQTGYPMIYQQHSNPQFQPQAHPIPSTNSASPALKSDPFNTTGRFGLHSGCTNTVHRGLNSQITSDRGNDHGVN
mmetsp:Transcript_6839/g.9401  ORF Transcript_6839/g.9401 Transcript_6839/m.9401 type:complete len:107 (+) Transcript_6839:122-442(+)